jgi:maleate isomerase
MHFKYDTIDPIGTRGTFGFIVLAPDETLENEMIRLLHAPGIALHVSRVPSAPEVRSETLVHMTDHMTDAAKLLPDSLQFDVVAYACTSGTSVIGASRVASLVAAGCHTRHVTDPVSALIAACRHLKVTRLALLSPYVEDVSAALRGVLKASGGIETAVFGSFDEAREARVARIAPQSIVDAATALVDRGGVDALFMSCTNLRTLEVIEEIEQATGLPVMSSNQVLGWHMARLAGIEPAGRYGRLMT